MSPRRRLFAIVLLLAALAATGALVGTALIEPPPSLGAPPNRPGPVLLIPGYGGGAAAFDPLADRLRSAGRDVTVVALPEGATGNLLGQARVVGEAADAALRRSGAPSVDVVGFSAGGVVARLWIAEGGRELARRVITLAAPNHGTDLAAFAGSLGGRLCPLACQQLAPGSALLRRLNAGDETPSGPQWLSVWTRNDAVVTPPSSARLDGAVDVALEDVCPTTVAGHGQVPAHPLVLALVDRALGTAPITAPTAADCSALRTVGTGDVMAAT